MSDQTTDSVREAWLGTWELGVGRTDGVSYPVGADASVGGAMLTSHAKAGGTANPTVSMDR